MNLTFWRKRPATDDLLTDHEDQIEWMESGGWKVELNLNKWDGNPWQGEIHKFIPMYHSADWYISHKAKGSLEKVVDQLYLNARKSLPPKELTEWK